MKRLILSLLATSVFVAEFGSTALAASWISINDRQAILDERINRGIEYGLLTRSEAIVLRGEFNTLARLEAEYRRSAPGLTSGERQDLDQRFDELRLRVKIQRHD